MFITDFGIIIILGSGIILPSQLYTFQNWLIGYKDVSSALLLESAGIEIFSDLSKKSFINVCGNGHNINFNFSNFKNDSLMQFFFLFLF